VAGKDAEVAVQPLRIYPDEILRQVCEPVARVDDSVQQLLDDLGESMYAHQGVGLAAPQIGVSRRAVVVDVAPRDEESQLIELVNPRVVEFSEETIDFEEGCLSLPDEAEMVTRPGRVVVEALDRRGKPFTVEAEGLLAVALQHEIDHLDGRLFIDYLSRLKRSLIDRRLRKRQAQAG